MIRSMMLVAGLFTICTTSAHAARIDLDDNSFASVVYSFGPIVEFTENTGGVTFEFKSVLGKFRSIGTWSNGFFDDPPFGMDIGGGGGSASGFTLSANKDVTLNSFEGLGNFGNTNPLIDISGLGVDSQGNTFSSVGFLSRPEEISTNLFVGGPLSLTAGEVYTFTVTNSSASTRGHITGFDFSVAAVPVPAALPLLATAFAAIGLLSWRRRQKATI